MKIKRNKVIWYSKLATVIVFVGTFVLIFWLKGIHRSQYQSEKYQQPQETQGQTEEITEKIPSPVSKYANEVASLVQDIEALLRKDGASDAFVNSFNVYKLDKNLEAEEVLVSYGVLINVDGHETLVNYYLSAFRLTKDTLERLVHEDIFVGNELRVHNISFSNKSPLKVNVLDVDGTLNIYNVVKKDEKISFILERGLPVWMTTRASSSNGNYTIINVDTMEEIVTFFTESEMLNRNVGDRQYIINNQDLIKASPELIERENYYGHFGHAVISDFDVNDAVIVKYYPNFYCNYVLNCTDDNSIIEEYKFTIQELIEFSNSYGDSDKRGF